MSIKKQYLKTKPVCKVTFRLPEEATKSVRSANIVGEFNDWNIYATPMKRLKNGSFIVTLDLEPNREYQFRYLLDDEIWENDEEADKHVLHPYGDGENSVVVL
ncbi:MAG: isoamylase early set domain-containing protein [Thermodesulfobacteriota bacterium]|nr:isoamylase early set domain-containing protein [Thermodesulfobacteriota bacterium]